MGTGRHVKVKPSLQEESQQQAVSVCSCEGLKRDAPGKRLIPGAAPEEQLPD